MLVIVMWCCCSQHWFALQAMQPALFFQLLYCLFRERNLLAISTSVPPLSSLRSQKGPQQCSGGGGRRCLHPQGDVCVGAAICGRLPSDGVYLLHWIVLCVSLLYCCIALVCSCIVLDCVGLCCVGFALRCIGFLDCGKFTAAP